jgi:ABC-type uncharacterized transport system substrate-binding protein
MIAALRIGLLAMAGVLLAPLGLAQPAHAQVALVLSEPGGAYQEAAEAFRQELARSAPAIVVVTTTPQELPADDDPRLIVTVGAQAARSVAALPLRPRAIHALIPRSTFEDLPREQRAHDAAVVLDQPAARQTALVRLALPAFDRVALLENEDSRVLADELADAARVRKFTLVRATVSRDTELYPALQKIFAEPAVLIATPDSQIFNSYNIQNILLTAYRKRSPLLGLSPAFVRAGAVLAVYSTPAQIGRQAAELASAALAGEPVTGPIAPRYFEIATNPQVARSMGIALDEPAALHDRLVEQEGRTP